VASPRDYNQVPGLDEASARAGGVAPSVPPPDGDRDSELPPSSSFAAEDFLFHLYRGAELLQDNRVGEAKEELEHALSLQPRDVEGQALLGVVYFRLGLYDRAIKIYSDIVAARPSEVTPRLNLGLCYLKTGQHHLARETYEELLRVSPTHPRAWGYLGLVFERIGEFEKAAHSFERAGQPNMARRMRQMLDRDSNEPLRPELSEVREVAAEAVHELEESHDAFSRAGPTHARAHGRWHSVELGEEPLPPPSKPFRARSLGAPRLDAPTKIDEAVPSAPPPAAITSPRNLVDRLLLSPPAGTRVHRRAPEIVLVRLAGPFALRLEHAHALLPDAGEFAASSLQRHARGRDLDEPLGGMRPLVLLSGEGSVVLHASSLSVTELDKEFFYAREDRLVAFDASLRHESGRLATGQMEHIPIVQFSGQGLVALRTSSQLYAVEVGSDKSAQIRAADVVGWIGRLLPQPLTGERAFGMAGGLVTFNGEGAVLLDPG
jgi:hypothetical protein